MADICVYLAVCHQAEELGRREEVGVGGILLLSPSSRWAAQPHTASVPGLLSPEEDTVSSSTASSQPSRPPWTGGCCWPASSSLPPCQQHNISTIFQHYISPPDPGLSMIPAPSSLPPSPTSWESAEAHSGQPAQALTSLDPKC